MDQHDNVRSAMTRCTRCSGAMLQELAADESQPNGLDVGRKCMLCGAGQSETNRVIINHEDRGTEALCCGHR